MSAIIAAITTVEFWFGVAVGIVFDETAKKALKSRLFTNSCDCDGDCCQDSADE